jgi:hypothetical protein
MHSIRLVVSFDVLVGNKAVPTAGETPLVLSLSSPIMNGLLELISSSWFFNLDPVGSWRVARIN